MGAETRKPQAGDAADEYRAAAGGSGTTGCQAIGFAGKQPSADG